MSNVKIQIKMHANFYQYEIVCKSDKIAIYRTVFNVLHKSDERKSHENASNGLVLLCSYNTCDFIVFSIFVVTDAFGASVSTPFGVKYFVVI